MIKYTDIVNYFFCFNQKLNNKKKHQLYIIQMRKKLNIYFY